MRKHILKSAGLGLLALALAMSPLTVSAQTTTTNKPASSKKASNSSKDTKADTKKKSSAHPFHGNLAAVDKVAKTITIGKSTYQITSETKITKAGKPALLEDGVIGEEAGGYAKSNDSGAMVATSVRFGPKSATTSGDKKPAKSDAAPK